VAFVEKTGPTLWRVRYWSDQGVHASITGFTSEAAARAKAIEIDVDLRRGTFQDPAAGRVPLGDWAQRWLDSLDLAPATIAQYRALTRVHILTRWGGMDLKDISGMEVHKWAAGLRRGGYAHSTVTTLVKLMSMMLADAARERLIPENPIHPQRRGRRQHIHRREVAWARPEQVLRIALQAAQLVGGWAGVLIITAAWTGARWGELTGLQRHNLYLHTSATAGRMVIDPHHGALHEVEGRLFLGPPKTSESARTITLPPFLVELLARHLDTHSASHVFVTRAGHLLRRSNFSRNAMRPATDGTLDKPRARHRLEPIVPGLTFHGFRHSHKTWMIEDGLPDVVQARRLGHTLPDKIEDIYSHVAPALEDKLLAHLQNRYETASAALGASEPMREPARVLGDIARVVPPLRVIDSSTLAITG
jgi:integrase